MAANTKQKKLIEDSFWTVYQMCGSRHDIDRAMNYIEDEEKQHRKMGHVFTDGTCRYNISVPLTVKYFLVKNLLDMTRKEKPFKPDAKEFLHVKTSCFAVWSLLHQHRTELRKVLRKIDREEFKKLDYCELVK